MFILFAFCQWYPQGGFDDTIEVFDTLEDAKARGAKLFIGDDCDHVHIGKLIDGKFVFVTSNYPSYLKWLYVERKDLTAEQLLWGPKLKELINS